MAQEEKPVRGRSPKKGKKMLKKLSSLPKAELAKVNFDNLWVMRPMPSRVVRDGCAPTLDIKNKAWYCHCRTICLV